MVPVVWHWCLDHLVLEPEQDEIADKRNYVSTSRIATISSRVYCDTRILEEVLIL